jgi:hypothetical protein
MVNSVDSDRPLSDLRSSIKTPTRATIFIDAADENYTTYGGKMPNIPTTRAGAVGAAVNAIADKTVNSAPARKLKANYYLNQATGGTTPKAATPKVRTSAEIPTGIANAARNAIGTNEGVRAMGTQNERNNQAVDQNIAQILQDYLLSGGNMQNIQQPQQMGDDRAYNVLQLLQTSPTMQQPISTPTTLQGALNGPTIGGLSQQQIQENMLIALQYGDTAMFNNLSKLNDMFNTASKPAQTKLSATQQRANAAATSLQQLSGMTPDMGYNLSGIPLLGDIATLGGNQYESTAKSLATQIGYMLSGANISEREAENIGKAYVPQPWDSEETRRYKLQQAQRIVAQYQQAYVEDTPTLETVLY